MTEDNQMKQDMTMMTCCLLYRSMFIYKYSPPWESHIAKVSTYKRRPELGAAVDTP